MALGGDGRSRTGTPFRRRITMRRDGAHAVEASIEDFMHHFEVRVTHDHGRVTAVDGRAVRAPWSTCPAAAAVLQELVGLPVGRAPRADQPASHCTHQLDLATAAVRFAGSDAERRQYDVTVTGWDPEPLRVSAQRDDGLRIELEISAGTVTAPEELAGIGLGQGFAAAVTTTFDAELAELVLVARRAAWMSPSRAMDLDDYELLAESGLPQGVCFASQPGRMEVTRRNRGASIADIT